jgi:hypothetical protein
MPIGSSKLGVLGAGLVPGGTETFNAPGNLLYPAWGEEGQYYWCRR